MNATNETQPLSCRDRYELNQTGLEPLSIDERLPQHIFLQTYMPGTITVVKIVMITWLTIGLFGNTLSFAIWVTKHQRRKSTSAIYLSALALADLILILTLVNYHVERYWGLPGVTSVNGLCQIYQCLTLFAQYYSTTLVFGFTLERYLAVCYPFRRHKLCSPQRAVLAIVILLLICAVPMLFQTVLWTYENGVCKMRMEWLRDPRIQWILTDQEIIFSLIVPLAALVFNILVLREMRRLIRNRAAPKTQLPVRRQTRKQSKLFLKLRKASTLSSNSVCASESPEDKAQQESSAFIATTIMLVILSFYLIACAVPPGVVYLAQFTWAQPDDCMNDESIRTDPEWNRFFGNLMSKEYIDLFCASHYALNVVIYLLTSKGFREHAIWILTCQVDKLKSLFRPVVDNWDFPRRTGPRLMSANFRLSENEENHTLVTDSDKCFHHQQNGNG
ncbi:7 transmembrane receptor [Opisthorchis viverrini]|uniref:Uncharacterized protein n=2 Tax=Opisthorchis viverrini TaxID=6198 RepID=A0A075A4V6_OPIVI|nr:hypothetical protein T265_00815 [Opisthorchis viverrini]KER33317.1 hypothetical protein T265_00815 [Opisthorchis viverrini]OON21926.1 7 transmembrane receptor [Opisthorchis viverrini]